MRKTRAPLTRSQIMARIGSKDTAPELRLRRALRARGVGYRLHVKGMPGRPDVVLVGARLAVFVHGCFWHRHPGCRRRTDPKTSSTFWQDKFRRNVERDARKTRQLMDAGWKVGVLWECEAHCDADLDLAVDAIIESRDLRLRSARSSC